MEHSFPILVKGGKLTLLLTVNTLPEGVPPPPVPERLRFEYEGYLPREMALELVRQTPGDNSGFRINGQTVLEFLESL